MLASPDAKFPDPIENQHPQAKRKNLYCKKLSP